MDILFRWHNGFAFISLIPNMLCFLDSSLYVIHEFFFFLSAHVYPPLQLLQDGLDLEFLLREILHSGIVHGTVRIATDFLSNAFCIHRLLCLFHFTHISVQFSFIYL